MLAYIRVILFCFVFYFLFITNDKMGDLNSESLHRKNQVNSNIIESQNTLTYT